MNDVFLESLLSKKKHSQTPPKIKIKTSGKLAIQSLENTKKTMTTNKQHKRKKSTNELEKRVPRVKTEKR